MLLAVSHRLDVGAAILAISTAADTNVLVLGKRDRIFVLGSYLVVVLIFLKYTYLNWYILANFMSFDECWFSAYCVEKVAEQYLVVVTVSEKF